MSSLGIKLPITYDSADGFTMIKTFVDLVQQNLEMLILTNPGERVMDPGFGCGLNEFLFLNPQQDNIESKIRNRITTQVQKYLPIITLSTITFNYSEIDLNKLNMTISYKIPDLGIQELIDITI